MNHPAESAFTSSGGIPAHPHTIGGTTSSMSILPDRRRSMGKGEVIVTGSFSNLEYAGTNDDSGGGGSGSTGSSSIVLESLSIRDIDRLAQALRPLLMDQMIDDTKSDCINDDDHDDDDPREEFVQEIASTSTTDLEEGRTGSRNRNPQWHAPFGESTYSLLYLCSIDSPAFWYAVLVYILQITAILLTMIDVVDWGSSNRLDLPPNVNLSVTIAQGVALFLAVAFQSDLLEVVSKFKDGFHPEVLEKHPGATYSTWLLSCIAQLFAGLLLLLTIYILTVQTGNVLGIMLNFAALNFMADIDDVAFYLAKSGFVGDRLQVAAYRVANFRVRKRYDPGRGFLRAWKTRIFFMIIAVLLTGWVTIVIFRFEGRYVCNTIMVNMGDDFVPSLGPFNGMYDLAFSGRGMERRAEYVERRSMEIDTPGRGILGYCYEIKAWTFRIESNDNNHKGNPCNWIARSSETETYDITETATSQWFVHDDTFREVVVEPFSLFCFDCAKEGESDDCGGKGTCRNAVCDCENGWYGLRCEFVSPCPWITMDARTDKFASTRDWASNYQSIDLGNGSLVEAYHRPVYIHEYSRGGEYDVVMFTGGRWALTSSKFLPHGGRISDHQLPVGQESAGSDIGNFFKHVYHGYRGYSGNYSVAFLSDYMEIGTHLDSSSPVGFHWYHAEEAKANYKNQDIGKSVDTEFLCHSCDDDVNPCLYDGVCNQGKCQCSLDSFGSLCEIPPVGNGHCDPFLNVPEFKLDGGDCCESSCESSSQYICGAEGEGYVSTGYYYCKQPKDEWQRHLLNGDAGSFSGFALDLSRGSMAVSELLQDRVRIYDKVGSSWVLRDTIMGSPNSRFGLRVALSSGPFNVVSNPSFKAPLTVVVADSFRILRVYKCDFDGCTQTQEFPTLLVFDFDLSDDGTVLAASLLVGNQAPNTVRIYDTVNGLFQFRADVSITRNNVTANVLSMSLNGDGSRLAVQSQLTEVDPSTNYPVATDEYVVVMAWNEAFDIYGVEAEFLFESEDNTVDYALSLKLSQDGTILAYGYPKCLGSQLHIQVRNDAGRWGPRWAPAMNSADCTDTERPARNNALAVSADGSRVAFRVGSKVKLMAWDSVTKSWNDVIDPFPLTHYPVAMSSNGKEIAIGAPEDGIGGVTGVFSLPGRKPCGHGMSLLRVSLTLDRLPLDVSGDLANNRTGEILFKQGPYSMEYAYATIVEETCIPADSCYVFTMYNKRRRGLQAPGQFALFVDGENVGKGSFDGLFTKQYFGECPSCPAGTVPFSMIMLACEPIPWALLQMVGTNNATNRWLASTAGNSEVVIPSTCSDHWDGTNCTEWLSYETCLEPSECYAFQFLSHHQAFVEIALGGQIERPTANWFCYGGSSYVGNPDKCQTGGVGKVVHSVGHT
ncbi:expressed unknown protein [Seminavis robusta]|uniref:EGF-like domain-containing protein n=1 Tax=Seminavis robusta TaxID=568900 RepID=A0A9N8HML4_9STRA|nr:expressed unknown protein [Seminavis robusta]|eukprot:Sro914_g219600.1 n/a (1391) ;mRNA; f:25256-29728